MKRLFFFCWIFSNLTLADEAILSLGQQGSVHYLFEDEQLLQVNRISPEGEVLYSHSYHYDSDGSLQSEDLIGELGKVIYEGDCVIQSPFSKEVCEYDDQHNLIRHYQDGLLNEYEYNDENELLLNSEGEECLYDNVGNIIQIGDHSYFTYDTNDKLIEAQVQGQSISYTYDLNGRRISKTIGNKTENYIYFGENEIAIFDKENRVKHLRIPGLPFRKGTLRPVAIETTDAIFAPIHDIQGNIIKLINIKNREIISLNKPGPFGNSLSQDSPSPWIFSGKHYDSDTDLVYFGARYYSPKIRKWLTNDPLFESSDLHQYCLNNPFYYYDPDGRRSEEAQEHYDNAKKSLVEGVAHSIGAGLAAVKYPPLAVVEVVQASTSFIDSAKEYNKGYDKEQEEKEEEEKNKKKG